MSALQPHRPPAIRAINRLGAALHRLGLPLPSLDERALIRAAERATGLDDFGDDQFREGLTQLLESLKQDARLNTMGRIMARRTVLGYLENRLRLWDHRKKHPELEAEPIRRPLFILGLPRTGTTVLFNLLAQDPANRAPLSWEVESPCPPPQAETFHNDPRIEAAERQFANLNRLAPTLRAIHEFGAELPQECVPITAHEFLSVQFHTIFNVTSYQTWLDRQSFLPALRFHRRFLQHLQSRCARERWVLKTPGHLPVIDELLQVYPDACIIHTHRDPLRVMPSLASLSYTLRALSSDDLDPHVVGRQQTELWGRNLDRALRARKALGERSEQFFDVRFEEVTKDPVALIGRIYAHFGLTLSDRALERMECYVRSHPRGEHGEHRYSVEDFGIDVERDGLRFRDYCERFHLRSEH
jgi:hypothetical protein